MAFASVAETGARPGDTVRCVTTSEPHRFTPKQEFVVVDFAGVPSVHGNSDRNTPPVWNIPWRGYGATWELVRRAKQ